LSVVATFIRYNLSMMSDERKRTNSTYEAKTPGKGAAVKEKRVESPSEDRVPLRRFRTFAEGLKHGMKVEWRETRAVPGQLLRGEFREAGEQVADLGRMGFLAALWVLPGGAILSGFFVKIFHRIRPSAFRHRQEKKQVGRE
jgi:hypothetical protein